MLEEFIIDIRMTDIFSIDRTISNIHPFFMIVTIKQEMTVIRKILLKLCILSACIKVQLYYMVFFTNNITQ